MLHIFGARVRETLDANMRTCERCGARILPCESLHVVEVLASMDDARQVSPTQERLAALKARAIWTPVLTCCSPDEAAGWVNMTRSKVRYGQGARSRSRWHEPAGWVEVTA